VVGGPRGALGYTVAVAGTALVTALLLAFRGDVSKTTVVLAYLLVVTGAAAAGGLGPGITAAGLGFLAFDLSTSLVAHGSLEGTLRGVVGTVRSLLDLAGCAIMLTSGDSLHLAAVDGQVPGDQDERVPMRSGEHVVGALVVVAGGPGSSEFGEAERRVLAASPTRPPWRSSGASRRSSATGPWLCRSQTGCAPPCSIRSPTTCAPRSPRSRPRRPASSTRWPTWWARSCAGPGPRPGSGSTSMYPMSWRRSWSTPSAWTRRSPTCSTLGGGATLALTLPLLPSREVVRP
jgi:Domain of unknown function (DUF4118)